ncbi:hypothetical protein EV363DRAFT_1433100, partial [Boletus edulis]
MTFCMSSLSCTGASLLIGTRLEDGRHRMPSIGGVWWHSISHLLRPPGMLFPCMIPFTDELCDGVVSHMTLTRLFSQDGAVRAGRLACANVYDHGSD